MSRSRDQLSEATCSRLIVALFELILARLRLNSRSARALTLAHRQSWDLSPSQAALVEQVAYIIPRVAARLPWRADCLVQALAAKRWLDRNGVATTLSLGVPREKAIEFEAHAWLTAGDKVVTGGDISNFQRLSRP